jgi:FixJ family two-component response regulator
MLATVRRQRAPVVSIIDDDSSIRGATSRLARSLGFEPQAFTSAEEFLQSAHLNDSSCIIADVRMPGMSGVSLQKLLIDKGHKLPFIFITAYPEEAVQAQAMEAGAIGFLSKPFEGKTLIKYLAMALKKPNDGPGTPS